MSETAEQRNARLARWRPLAARLDKELPDDWQTLWKHVDLALEKATRGPRDHSAMFVFVREIMTFPFSGDWRNDPDRIATLMEKMCLRRTFDMVKAGFSYEPNRASIWETYGLDGGRDEFIAVWMDMRYPPGPGKDPLQLACGDSCDLSLTLKGMSSSKFADVLTLAYHLQKRAGDRDIVLPQQRIADALCVSQRIVSTYIALAIRRGFLIAKSDWDFGQKRAKRYHFRLDRFDEKGREK